MRNILLTISYDGTHFCGWQRQDKSCNAKPVRTVQAVLEESLSKLHHQPIILHGSGRTDSGVHAYGQAADFISPIDSIPVSNYLPAINALLPKDVRIMSAQEVPADFHSRYSATSRVYRYFLWCDKEHSVPANLMSYVWNIRRPIHLDRLNAMCACLHGELDCASFAAAGDQSVSTCRYIESARFFTQQAFPAGELVVFEIEANAFLWHMVRNIVGTLVTFEQNGKPASCISDLLAARDRKKAGPTAPAEGLFLWQVKFDGVRRHV
ncbi:MAG: tRNA pseudouridine(38-40) synthase TruA [Treponema sp.]|nr:tRNA pseudouridine(38-40) synthase TruA [Treponema sp.]